MRIGILTYHRSHNYGALLQAIALRYYLQKNGHNVFFVDYWPAYHKHFYAVVSLMLYKQLSIRGYYYYLLDCVKHFSVRKARSENFRRFISNYIEPYTASLDDEFDLLVHGSDQIWRIQSEINCFNPIYFGVSNIKSRKRVSYAASMGVTSISDHDKVILKDYLAHLDNISVREQDLMNLVNSLGFDCKQHLDPALLLTGNEWKQVMQLKQNGSRKYVLYYDLLPNSFNKFQLSDFAKERDCEIVTIYGGAIGKNTDTCITTADPLRFLNLINGAEFVFTSSFHGLVFSLLFHKPFYAAFSMNAGRARSILSQVGLDKLLLEPLSEIPYSEPIIDFSLVDAKLEQLRKSSKDYLNSITEF